MPSYLSTGADNIKKYWSRYYQGSQGVVFVLDSASSDEDLEAARNELHSALQHPQLCTLPFLILANHQDKPAARTPSQVSPSGFSAAVNLSLPCFSWSSVCLAHVNTNPDASGFISKNIILHNSFYASTHSYINNIHVQGSGFSFKAEVTYLLLRNRPIRVVAQFIGCNIMIWYVNVLSYLKNCKT